METKLKPDIQLVDIESELKRLWEINREKHVTKASLFNLVIFAPDERRTNYLKTVVQSIIEKFPCRLLFIQVKNKSPDDFLHVKVSTAISDMEGACVACDQIALEVTPNFLDRIPSIIIPHLQPDLPIYLLWGKNPVEEKIVLPALLKFASRLIFDSECLETLSSFGGGMLEKLNKFRLDIMDMNWALSSVWRDVFIQIFDTPDKIRQLNESQQIQIVFNSHKTDILEHAEIRALYVQAWLASRLDWKFQSIQSKEDEWIISYMKSDRLIKIILIPEVNTDLSPGSIISIDINSYQDENCHITRKQKLSQVTVNLSTRDKCELPYTLPLPDVHRGFAFLREIFYHSMSNQYRTMLKTFSFITCNRNSP